jgi:flagellar biosynthesis protein FlhG
MELRDSLLGLYEDRIGVLTENTDIHKKSLDIVRYYLRRNRDIRSEENYLEELKGYLIHFLQMRITLESNTGHVDDSALQVSEEEYRLLSSLVHTIKNDSILQSIRLLLALLGDAIDEEVRHADFAVDRAATKKKAVDREIASLLTHMSRSHGSLPVTHRNFAGLILFYFALYKLVQSRSVITLIKQFIPTKTDHRNRTVRDRNSQIRFLIEKNNQYRKRYFAMIKTLYPLIMKQINVITKTFGFGSLLFRSNGKPDGSVYAKLISGYLHNTVNSGLSIIIGFPFRPASVAFGEASEELLSKMKSNSRNSTTRTATGDEI